MKIIIISIAAAALFCGGCAVGKRKEQAYKAQVTHLAAQNSAFKAEISGKESEVSNIQSRLNELDAVVQSLFAQNKSLEETTQSLEQRNTEVLAAIEEIRVICADTQNAR